MSNTRDLIRENLLRPKEGSPVDALLSEFVIIPRADLPEFKVIDGGDGPHVDCGSDWGTWDVKHVDRMRETALEYVGAWLTAEKWHADEAERAEAAKNAAIDRRRDELAREFGFALPYLRQNSPLARAVDRIIELEGKSA